MAQVIDGKALAKKIRENLKVECPKYGIEYIDTHINREEILNKIMDKLEKEIK